MYRSFITLLLALVIYSYSGTVIAQSGLDLPQIMPETPDPIASLEKDGAQIRYMGRESGYDGWVAIKQGQEQYFYSRPDSEVIFLGLMFDNKGKLLTVGQVAELQKREPGLNKLAGEDDGFGIASSTQSRQVTNDEFKIPSERLFSDIEESNWISLGNLSAPAIYMFIEPDCPHCRAAINDFYNLFVKQGKLNLRLIPVGFSNKNVMKSAFVIAAPNPEKRIISYINGDSEALEVDENINTQAVEVNMSIMQKWKFDAVPMIVYRDANNVVKIVKSRPQNPNDIYTDITDK